MFEVRGSYEFGVDAVSGSLTVTSKDTGSVDILEGIEMLPFGDGSLTVSQTPDAAFESNSLCLLVCRLAIVSSSL